MFSEASNNTSICDDTRVFDDENFLIGRDTLTFSLLIFSIINLTILLFFWLFLIHSSGSRTLTLFPHLLLLSLFLGSSTNVAQCILEPTSLPSCYLSLLIPISLTMIYSTIQVRLLYLLYILPSLYQNLLVFLCILVQVFLSINVLLLTQINDCSSHSSFFTDLVSFSYSFLLLISIIIISVKLLRISRNKGEAWAILILSLMSLVLWIVWVTAVVLYQEHYTSIKGFGFQTEAFLTTFILLLPTPRRLSYIKRSGESSSSCNSCSYHSTTSSYMGFHRPTRVVPPSCSSSSDSISSSNGHPKRNLSKHFLQVRRAGYQRLGSQGPIPVEKMPSLQEHCLYGQTTYSVFDTRNFYFDGFYKK